MAGDDYRKREACKMAAWIKPKMAHKQMVQRLLQVKAHLILCFRAEDKMKMEKDANGKTQIVPIGWQPICSKEMPYELTVSFLLSPDKPGIPIPLKLQEQHKPMFPSGKLLDESCGQKIAQWAKGSTTEQPKGEPVKEPVNASIASMKKEIAGMMKGISDKKDFYDFVIAEETLPNLQEFKEHFDSYRQQYVKARSAQ